MYGGRDRGWEGCIDIGVASGAMFYFCTVLGDHEFLGWQVKDLAALMSGGCLILKFGATAVGAEIEWNYHGMVGTFHGLEGAAGVSWLTA